MREEGRVICKLGEEFFASVFSGLGRSASGRALDIRCGASLRGTARGSEENWVWRVAVGRAFAGTDFPSPDLNVDTQAYLYNW